MKIWYTSLRARPLIPHHGTTANSLPTNRECACHWTWIHARCCLQSRPSSLVNEGSTGAVVSFHQTRLTNHCSWLVQWTVVGDVEVNTGANASAEEAEEGVDSSSRKVVDVIDSFGLVVCSIRLVLSLVRQGRQLQDVQPCCCAFRLSSSCSCTSEAFCLKNARQLTIFGPPDS